MQNIKKNDLDKWFEAFELKIKESKASGELNTQVKTLGYFNYLEDEWLALTLCKNKLIENGYKIRYIQESALEGTLDPVMCVIHYA